uniref:hypothetical protein n=1 Tax=uncultured Draconibacterium sp. TaxID=1573823 RepID=UPI003217259E
MRKDAKNNNFDIELAVNNFSEGVKTVSAVSGKQSAGKKRASADVYLLSAAEKTRPQPPVRSPQVLIKRPQPQKTRP